MLEFLRIRNCLVFISLISACSALHEIPSFLHICHKSDPDIKRCITSSMETLRPQFQNGNAEYNIPSVEPIIIKDLIKDTSGPLKLETTEVIAYGGGNYEIIDVMPDIDNMVFKVDINIPILKITAKYNVNGKVMMLVIKDDGIFNANLTNCYSQSTLVGKVVDKDDGKHFTFSDFEMKITVGGGTVVVDNMFNGDKTLTKMVNDVINSNLQAFLKVIMPFVEKGLGNNFMKTANQIVAPYTIDQLFPA